MHYGCCVIAPRDELLGGTWIGMNAHGVAVALTVRDVRVPRADVRYRSRGLLVLDALAKPTAVAAADAAWRAHHGEVYYRPFHLIAIDWDADTVVTVHAGERSGCDPADRMRPFHATAYPSLVVTEQSFGAGRDRRAMHIAAELERFGPDPTDDQLRAILSLHDREHPFDGTCVHTEHRGHAYGTKSSTIIALGRDGAYRYLHAEGPPCTTPHEVVAEGNIKDGSARERTGAPGIPAIGGSP